MEAPADHHAIHRNTTGIIEIKEIKQSEQTHQLAEKYKWYLTDHHGMIQSLLVPDYYHDEILSIFGMLAIIALMCVTTPIEQHNSTCITMLPCAILYTFIVTMILWSLSTKWSRLIASEGWQVLTEDDAITNRLIQRNSTHLSMSGESPFARGYLTDAIGKDGEGDAVDDILKVTF